MPALDELNEAALASAVKRAVGRTDIVLLRWHSRSIHDPFNRSTAGLYRIAGTARAGDELIPWSVVLKVVRSSDDSFGGAADVSDANYWAREALLFESRTLQELPGVRAPSCFGVDWRADTTACIWLEDVADSVGPSWPLSQYTRVARHLGEFNGAYLTGRPLPTSTHVSRHWHRSFVGDFAAAFDQLPRLRDHPLIRRCWPDTLLDRIEKMWEDRDALLVALDALPQTFCHLDAYPRNLLIDSAAPDVAAVDWSYAGIAAVGAELAPLVAASACVGDIEADQLADIEVAAFDGYTAGLRAAGWHGHDATVRLGYVAAVALHYGLVPLGIYLTDDHLRLRFERLFKCDAARLADRWAAVSAFLVERADEAHSMLRDERA